MRWHCFGIHIETLTRATGQLNESKFWSVREAPLAQALGAFLFWRSYAGMILAVLDYALECFNWEYGRGSALSSVSRLTLHFCHKRQTT